MSAWAVNQPGDATPLDVPTDILCSYHYFAGVNLNTVASWGTRIIGDSGAFSAMTLGKPVDREEFHAWASANSEGLFWTAALDVIGDPEATFGNWIAARADGLELVPTLHYGADPRDMDRLVEHGATLIGLGGMVPYSSEKDRLMRWCLSMHRYARDNHPEVRFHGWGISHPYLVDNLPWWSTDSSGFSSCFRFGTLRLWVPRRGAFTNVDLNGRDLARHAKLLRDVYGCDWRTVASSTPTNRREVGRVALRSVQLYARWLRSRQQVTAPALLIPKLTGMIDEGPLSVAAMMPSAQGQAITPGGWSVTVDAPLGPIQVAADTSTQLAFINPNQEVPA